MKIGIMIIGIFFLPYMSHAQTIDTTRDCLCDTTRDCLCYLIPTICEFTYEPVTQFVINFEKLNKVAARVYNDSIPIYTDVTTYDSIQILYITHRSDCANMIRKFSTKYSIFKNVKYVRFEQMVEGQGCDTFKRENYPDNWSEVFPNIEGIGAYSYQYFDEKLMMEFNKLKHLVCLELIRADWRAKNKRKLVQFINQHPTLKYLDLGTMYFYNKQTLQDFVRDEIKKDKFHFHASWYPRRGIKNIVPYKIYNWGEGIYFSLRNFVWQIEHIYYEIFIEKKRTKKRTKD